MRYEVCLGPIQQAAVAIYVTDPAHEQTACWLDGDRLVIADLDATLDALIEGANSADCDGDWEFRRALERVFRRVCRNQRR